DVPIVMLTARDAERDRVLGLDVGADDYVTKPFSSAELLSRVRAILRRRELDRASAVRTLGGLRLDLGRHEVTVDGDPVRLTLSEFKVLSLLAERPESVVSRRELMQHLWASEHVGDEHACEVHISNLRRKIERDPTRPQRLVTVRGSGYKLLPVQFGTSAGRRYRLHEPHSRVEGAPAAEGSREARHVGDGSGRGRAGARAERGQTLTAARLTPADGGRKPRTSRAASSVHRRCARASRTRGSAGGAARPYLRHPRGGSV